MIAGCRKERLLPLLKLRPVCTSECQVVEPWPPLVEGFRPVQIGELVDADQGLAPKEPNDVMKRIDLCS